MTRLELLNVFLNDRLTAAAEEIFRAVKDTVLEYQSEILCAKEENERLKRLLNVAVQRLLLQPESHPALPHDDVQPCESEGRGSAPTLPQVKEEPKSRNLQADDPREAGDADGGGGVCLVQSRLTPQPPLAQTVCDRSVSPPHPPAPPQELKAEDDDGGGEDGSPVYSNCRETRRDGPGETNRGGRGLLKQNARSLRAPAPHSSQSLQRWHSCQECGKGFSFACQLEVHMRWHTKEKPYSCAVCRKSFTTVSMLKRHHRIHTGEKPFRCLVCGKCFNQSAHLNTHFRLHTREGPLEPAAIQLGKFSRDEADPAVCKL
ncbi:zinc finger and SCAN domain-containing protein 32-like [Antennarius striatus]|uniref:zinc finger and SCAN domain-containing protein 32-like n=1 Tax=Antennarius striatus TaxID=241820 RepID=UPI0035AF22DF